VAAKERKKARLELAAGVVGLSADRQLQELRLAQGAVETCLGKER
jgi:hypothetical protein